MKGGIGKILLGIMGHGYTYIYTMEGGSNIVFGTKFEGEKIIKLTNDIVTDYFLDVVSKKGYFLISKDEKLIAYKKE